MRERRPDQSTRRQRLTTPRPRAYASVRTADTVEIVHQQTRPRLIRTWCSVAHAITPWAPTGRLLKGAKACAQAYSDPLSMCEGGARPPCERAAAGRALIEPDKPRRHPRPSAAWPGVAQERTDSGLTSGFEDQRSRDLAVVALPEIDRAAVFEQALVAGAPCGAPALPFGWRSVQSSRPALTCIIGARRAWIVPMISSTSIPCR